MFSSSAMETADLPHAQIHTSFLKSNAQAHNPLSAIADILDNSRETRFQP